MSNMTLIFIKNNRYYNYIIAVGSGMLNVSQYLVACYLVWIYYDQSILNLYYISSTSNFKRNMDWVDISFNINYYKIDISSMYNVYIGTYYHC